MPMYKISHSQIIASYTDLPNPYPDRPLPPKISELLRGVIASKIDLPKAAADMLAVSPVQASDIVTAARLLAPEVGRVLTRALIGTKVITEIEPVDPGSTYTPTTSGSHEVTSYLEITGTPLASTPWTETVMYQSASIDCFVCIEFTVVQI